MDVPDETSNASNPPVYRPTEPLELDFESHGISHESSSRSSEAEIEVESPIHPDIEESLPPAYELPIFTMDGGNISFLNNDIQRPQYRLSGNIFDGKPGYIIGLSRLLDSPDRSDGRRVLRHLYKLTTTSDTARWINIEGQHLRSYGTLYLGHESGKSISSHSSWAVTRKESAVPLLVASVDRSAAHLHLPGHRSDADRRIQWRDGDGTVVATEHKAVYSKNGGVETSPTLEIVAQVDEKMMGALLAAWMARVWQEAIHTHGGHFSMSHGKAGRSAAA